MKTLHQLQLPVSSVSLALAYPHNVALLKNELKKTMLAMFIIQRRGNKYYQWSQCAIFSFILGHGVLEYEMWGAKLDTLSLPVANANIFCDKERRVRLKLLFIRHF